MRHRRHGDDLPRWGYGHAAFEVLSRPAQNLGRGVTKSDRNVPPMRRPFVATTAILLASLAASTVCAAERKRHFDIADGMRLEDALTSFSWQADRDILFQPGIVADARAHGVTGLQAPTAALTQLLQDTGLVWREVQGRLLIERGVTASSVGAAPSATLDALVVTATRRPTIDQLTPMSVRALSGHELAHAGVSDLSDARAILPGLNHLPAGTGRNRLSLRGVHASGEMTTALYYDDMPVTGPSGTTADPGGGPPELLLVDLDRIEVLRGPQGTLYGSGAMGGALKVMFKRPDATRQTAQIGGEVEAAAGNLGTTTTAVFNTPLPLAGAAARLTAYRRVEPGYIYNQRLDQTDVNETRIEGARLGLAMEASSALQFGLTSAIQTSDFDDSGTAVRGGPALVSAVPVRSPFRSRLALHQGQARARLGGVELTANAGAYTWRTTRQSDYTGVLTAERMSPAGCARYFADLGGCDANQLAAYSAYVDSRSPGVLHQPDKMDAQVQELRLQSAGSGFLAWTLGVFREVRKDTMDSQVLAADPRTGAARPDLGFTGRRLVSSRLRQRAAYGETTLGADRPSSLTLGARRFEYNRRTVGSVLVPNIISNTTNANFDSTADEAGWSLKVLASHRFGSDSLAYVQAAQGFRPGGANTAPVPQDLAIYRSDSLWSYEAGVKLAWPERPASLNIAVYRIDWRDMQFSAASANGAFSFITNVGRARIDGVELDAALADGPNRAGLNLTLNRAELIEDQESAEAIGLGSAGDHLPFVPHVAFNIWGEHTRRLPWDFDLLLRADIDYLGRAHSTFRPGAANDTAIGDAWQINLRANALHGPWRFGVHIENLLDSHRAVTATTGNTPQVYPMRPRRVGMSATYEF